VTCGSHERTRFSRTNVNSNITERQDRLPHLANAPELGPDEPEIKEIARMPFLLT
jgi:hypothetical protein